MRFMDHQITIEILNGYLVVCCRNFDIFQVAGNFNANVERLVTPSEIGDACFKVMVAVEDLVNKNNQVIIKKQDLNELITMEHAAFILKLSVSTVRRLIDADIIESDRIAKKRRRPYLWSVYRYKNEVQFS